MLSPNSVTSKYRFLKGVVRNTCSKVNARKVLKIFPDVSPDEYFRQLSDIKKIDSEITGRYCGSLEDKVMQCMCCYHAAKKFPSDPQYCHVEIGVLFGGSILAKLSVLRRLNISQTVIAIDPFEGYYRQPRDPLTRAEITEENFLSNVTRFGFDGEMVRVIKKYSTDEAVKQALANYKVISLMIDGDHTYDGVRNDWEKYSDLIETGGYVIFDDYAEPAWPDVTKFVDELLARKDKSWNVLGRLDTTLIMRRN